MIRLIMCAREPFKWVKKEICDVLSFVIPKQKKPPFRTDMIQSKAVTVFSMIWPLGSTQQGSFECNGIYFNWTTLARGYESELLIEKEGKDISELQSYTTMEGAYNYFIDLFFSFVGHWIKALGIIGAILIGFKPIKGTIGGCVEPWPSPSCR